MSFLKTLFILAIWLALGYSAYIIYLIVGLEWFVVGLFFIICLVALIYLSKEDKWH